MGVGKQQVEVGHVEVDERKEGGVEKTRSIIRTGEERTKN